MQPRPHRERPLPKLRHVGEEEVDEGRDRRERGDDHGIHAFGVDEAGDGVWVVGCCYRGGGGGVVDVLSVEPDYGEAEDELEEAEGCLQEVSEGVAGVCFGVVGGGVGCCGCGCVGWGVFGGHVWLLLLLLLGFALFVFLCLGGAEFEDFEG